MVSDLAVPLVPPPARIAGAGCPFGHYDDDELKRLNHLEF
jgi:hypothetical protein